MTRRHGDEGFAGALLASTGGGGGGGCGLLLLLFFVAMLVNYWWVVALVIGAAAAIWFGIRAIRDEARAARLRGMQHPVRRISTKPPKPKKEPPLSGDALTAKLRADKRRQRQAALEEWDRDWDRLLGPSLRIGQPVTIAKRIPANAAYPAQAESGSTGTVIHVGPPNRAPGLCPIQVRLDRTGRVVVVLEKYLVPRSGGLRGR
jgi:hypothetical protein